MGSYKNSINNFSLFLNHINKAINCTNIRENRENRFNSLISLRDSIKNVQKFYLPQIFANSNKNLVNKRNLNFVVKKETSSLNFFYK